MFACAEVEDLAECIRCTPRAGSAIHHIVDEIEVAPLRAAPEDEELISGERLPEPDAEERLARILHAHPGTERVGQPQDGGAESRTHRL